MTIIAAASWYDKRGLFGYALASDMRVGYGSLNMHTKGLQVTKTFSEEKVFTGPTTVGFISGSMVAQGENWRETVRSLDGRLEDIALEKEYEEIPLLDPKYIDAWTTLVVAKRRSLGVELYEVRMNEQNKWKAHRLHQISRHSRLRDLSSVWVGPFKGKMDVCPLKDRLTAVQAQHALILHLTESSIVAESLGYQPESKDIALYLLSPESMGRVDVGNGMLMSIRSNISE